MAISRSEQASLHRALLAGDPTAPSRIADALLGPLIEALKFNWPHRDPHEIEQQAIDSLMNYFGAPERFNPAGSALLTYLRMDAQGDLTNSYRASPLKKEIASDDVELESVERNELVEAAYDDPDEEEQAESELDAKLNEAFPDPKDRAVVELLRDGVRSTDDYADVLEVTHLDPVARREFVQRVKDRIKKKLDRLFPGGSPR